MLVIKPNVISAEHRKSELRSQQRQVAMSAQRKGRALHMSCAASGLRRFVGFFARIF